MPKEKHSYTAIPQNLVNRLWGWQKKLRFVSSVVPARKLPLLTPAEAYGPDIERFRDTAQSLVSWWDKQSQQWHFRGSLRTEKGRLLGYQLAFSDRHTQNDFVGAIPARWLTPRVFAAHFTITDPMNGESARTFRSWQRGGLISNEPGFAADDRFHVELGGWHAYRRSNGSIALCAGGDGDSIHLELVEEKPLAYHGQSGYAEVDPAAAFYCSSPRIKTTGRILLEGKLEEVSGYSWLDHEKLTSHSLKGTAHQNLDSILATQGWDRMAVQLSSGHDLMIFIRKSGQAAGSWIDSSGSVKHLISTDIQIGNIEYWTSPATSARYPIKRRLRIEPLNLELDWRASVPHQEISMSRSTMASQWEGLTTVSGKLAQISVDGMGFMEFVGYDPRARAKVYHFLTGA